MRLRRNISHNFNYQFIKRQLLLNHVYLGGYTSKWVKSVGFYISGSRFSLFIINLRFSLFMMKRALFFIYENRYKGNRGLLYDYVACVNFDFFLNRYNFLTMFFHPSEQPFFFGKWFGGLITNYMVFAHFVKEINVFYYKYFNQLCFYNTWDEKFDRIVVRFPKVIKAYVRQYVMKDFICNPAQSRKKFLDRLTGVAHLLSSIKLIDYYTINSVRCINDSFYRDALTEARESFRAAFYGPDIYEALFKVFENNVCYPRSPHYHKYVFEFLYSEPHVDINRTKALARIRASYAKMHYVPPYDIELSYKIMRRLILNMYALLFLYEVPHYFLAFDLKHARVAVSECFKYKVPVVSLMDTAQSLHGIHYPIITNTNRKCTLFFLFLFKNVFFHSRVSKFCSIGSWFKQSSGVRLLSSLL